MSPSVVVLENFRVVSSRKFRSFIGNRFLRFDELLSVALTINTRVSLAFFLLRQLISLILNVSGCFLTF